MYAGGRWGRVAAGIPAVLRARGRLAVHAWMDEHQWPAHQLLAWPSPVSLSPNFRTAQK